MPHSHHSHSGQFCRHAKDTLSAVVAEAARRGFRTFALTEHCPRYRVEDLYPEEDLATTYEAFLLEAARLRAAYADTLSLLIGIESDYITQLDVDGMTRYLARPEIDYVVGSVHHVRTLPIDFDRATWLKAVVACSPGAEATAVVTSDADADTRLAPEYTPTHAELAPFLEAYLDAQYELLQATQPEVVGHFDLCLLYTPDVRLAAMGGSVWDKVERNVRYAVGYGALFEANAAAIRKGWTTSYPGADVLNLVTSLGGKVCLSDDSHGVAFVGLNYLPMRDYLVAHGVDTVWSLVPAKDRQQGDEAVGPRGRVVARPLPGWDKDVFWTTFAATASAK